MVFLTDDRDIDARALLNEYGDHWGQEFAHRVGKHDLCLDILPPGYVLRTRRDEQGQLVREVEDDDTARTALPWLNNLVVQFRIAEEEPIHPLTETEKRNRLFGDG